MILPTRILIAEDERIAAEDVRRRLESWGYQVQGVVSSGEEAILKAEQMHPDLMLMDIQLKGSLDGIEAGRRIREKTGIPVVYASASSDSATRQRVAVSEPFGFISKPFDDREIRSTIELAVMRRQMESRQHDSSRLHLMVLQSLSEAIVATDSTGRIRFANPRAHAILESPGDSLQGKYLRDVLQFRDGAPQALRSMHFRELSAEDADTACCGRVCVAQPSGSSILVDLRVAPLKDVRGSVSGIVVTLQEVTMVSHVVSQEA